MSASFFSRSARFLSASLASFVARSASEDFVRIVEGLFDRAAADCASVAFLRFEATVLEALLMSGSEVVRCVPMTSKFALVAQC